jgi:hypothetical protein
MSAKIHHHCRYKNIDANKKVALPGPWKAEFITENPAHLALARDAPRIVAKHSCTGRLRIARGVATEKDEEYGAFWR